MNWNHSECRMPACGYRGETMTFGARGGPVLRCPHCGSAAVYPLRRGSRTAAAEKAARLTHPPRSIVGAAEKAARLTHPPRSIVGSTVLGDPSVADVRTLIEAKDYTIQQLLRSWQDTAPDWTQRDKPAAHDWSIDMAALVDRYQAARKNALEAIAELPSYSNARASWNAILKSLRKNWDDETQTGGKLEKGDLSELDARLEAAGARPDFSKMPQPNPADDHSLRLFQAADKATRAIEHAVKTGGNALPWIAGALVAAVLLRATSK